MKVTDLMVGDWVLVAETNQPRKIEGTNDLLFHNDYIPIPLTEEILVKNGFALDKTLAEIGTKVYTRPCPASELSVKVFHDGSICFGFIKLTYVHTLQHLLRLCGVQKEIEL